MVKLNDRAFEFSDDRAQFAPEQKMFEPNTTESTTLLGRLGGALEKRTAPPSQPEACQIDDPETSSGGEVMLRPQP